MLSSPIHPPHELKERRRFARFTPKNGTMAVSNHTLGPIANISMGGLSFQCMDDDNNKSLSDFFGIFLGSDDILIDKIQGQIVSDKLERPKNIFAQTKTRQLSIRFLKLSSDQRKRLKEFILTKTHCVARAD